MMHWRLVCGNPVALAVLRGPWCYALFGLGLSVYRHLETCVLEGESDGVPTVFFHGCGQSHMQWAIMDKRAAFLKGPVPDLIFPASCQWDHLGETDAAF